MNIGDLVMAQHGVHLRSGASAYDHAIVCSIEPFIMVSRGTDMMWSTMKSDDVFSVAPVAPSIVNRCMQRLHPEQQRRMHEGERWATLHLGCGLVLHSVGIEDVDFTAFDMTEKSTSYRWLFERDANNGWKAKRKLTDDEFAQYVEMMNHMQVIDFFNAPSDDGQAVGSADVGRQGVLSFYTPIPVK